MSIENNYGFKILSDSLSKQTLNVLAVNYKLEPPVNNMEKRIYAFEEKHPLGDGIPPNFKEAINSIRPQTTSYFNGILQVSSNGLYLTSLAGYLFPCNNISITLLSAVDSTLNSTVSLPGTFTATYNRKGGYLKVTYSNSDFNYSNYSLMFNVEGITINNSVIIYKLQL